MSTDALAVGPFLQGIGGDTTVAEESGTIMVRGETDCNGNLTLRPPRILSPAMAAA